MSQFWKPGQAAPPAGGAPNAQQSKTSEPPKQNLSKSVMSMKFMSRKREAAQNEEEEKAKRVKLENDKWSTQTPVESSGASGRFQRDDSNPYSSLPGRRSFGGFNTVVERNYANALGIAVTETPKINDDKAPTEEEMAKHYESLISLPRGPNQGRAPPRPVGNGSNNKGSKGKQGNSKQ